MGQITGSICDAAHNCQNITLLISSSTTDIDYGFLSALFATSFGSVLFLYIFSSGIGHVISMFKRF